MENAEGLSALLERGKPHPSFQQVKSVCNLTVLPAGDMPVNPAGTPEFRGFETVP